MCAPHKIEEENLLAQIPTAVPEEEMTTTGGAAPEPPEPIYHTPDTVLQNPPFAPEAPMSRVEAIQILTRGLAFADRRTRSAHFMAIHALAKRAAEEMRRKMRKEGGSHD